VSETDDPLIIESIDQVHRIATATKPAHPLISVVGASWQPPMDVKVPLLHRRIISNLYAVSLKRGNECGLKYGRTYYDFQEGSLLCLAPGQSIIPITEPSDLDSEHAGWTLLFHPDLLRRTNLAEQMREYSFFGYESHEALHLSETEGQTLTSIVQTIEKEYAHIDAFSDELLVSHLQLFLNYCKRFYARQFISRSNPHQDVVVRLEKFLGEYFQSVRPAQEGLPNVVVCAKAMGYSADYLSDLLRKETGRNTRDHIHHFLIEQAKNRLLSSDQTVSEIAFSLGFEHPQHFSKLFKSKTGLSPGEYRQ
jgi:AraC family transcriptional regulator, transcriptional activator of pobA